MAGAPNVSYSLPSDSENGVRIRIPEVAFGASTL